jgi:hypothetical protein
MQFRYHRGGLEESMATLQIINTQKEFYNLFASDTCITIYMDAPDTRIGWSKTFIAADGNGVIGFCDELPDTLPKD